MQLVLCEACLLCVLQAHESSLDHSKAVHEVMVSLKSSDGGWVSCGTLSSQVWEDMSACISVCLGELPHCLAVVVEGVGNPNMRFSSMSVQSVKLLIV